MLDQDLAKLYGVPTKRLNEQVKRNLARFPEDFMFQLTKEETLQILNPCSRSQIATLKQGQNIKYFPYAFTQEGIAMLSGILNSPQAIYVNIQIMRTFVKLRQILATHKELADKLKELENRFEGRLGKHQTEINQIFKIIRKLMLPPRKKKYKIGFLRD